MAPAHRLVSGAARAGTGAAADPAIAERGAAPMNETSSVKARDARPVGVRPLRVAALGIGWWSDVLADAVKRSDLIDLVACYTRSEAKRRGFASKYACRAAASYEDILDDDTIEAVLNTTPNGAHLETVAMAAAAGKHVFLDKPIANTVAEGSEIARICDAAGVVLALGYQRRREHQFRWIKAEIDLSSWRYQAAGMPGGVMLQIGIHYVDVLEMLLGPVKRVSGMSAQLVLPGDNPDVAAMMLEHDSGAVSNLTASYASAGEYYMLNVYGKEASAFYDLFNGLRHFKRGETGPRAVAVEPDDTIREELEEFVRCIREGGRPETDGWWATRNLAVVRAGVKSAREGRAVEVAEIMASGE
jgi:predicted dehydrogenase